ncbi:hypothetical protein WJX84_007093 [Apatococcus fuscideae]|uniref:RRM domain-containing protein n=1 Tax=Apatococcus fuscideae TaxID=2026836 RepID=A0AAW1RXB5_9CHLO
MNAATGNLLRIRNIEPYVTTDEFSGIFLQLDGCTGCRLVKAADGSQEGYVEFQDNNTAKSAKALYNGWTGWGQRGLEIDYSAFPSFQPAPAAQGQALPQGQKRAREDAVEDGNAFKQARSVPGANGGYNADGIGAPAQLGQSMVQQGTLSGQPGYMPATSMPGGNTSGSLPTSAGYALPQGQMANNAQAPTGSQGMMQMQPSANPTAGQYMGGGFVQQGGQPQLQGQTQQQPQGQPQLGQAAMQNPQQLQQLQQFLNQQQQQQQGMQQQLQQHQAFQPGQQQMLGQMGGMQGQGQQAAPQYASQAAQNPQMMYQGMPQQQAQQPQQMQTQQQQLPQQIPQQMPQQVGYGSMSMQQMPQGQMQQPSQMQQPGSMPMQQPGMQQPGFQYQPQPQQGMVMGQQQPAMGQGMPMQQPQMVQQMPPQQQPGPEQGAVGLRPVSVIDPVELPPDASQTLYLERLPQDLSKRELAHIFRPFEGYATTRVVTKDSVKHPGEKQVMGFVEFTNAIQSSAAMHTLQNYPLDRDDEESHVLRIMYARPQLKPAPGERADRRPGGPFSPREVGARGRGRFSDRPGRGRSDADGEVRGRGGPREEPEENWDHRKPGQQAML